MKIVTRDFGVLEVDEKLVIEFVEGIPGFEELKNYIIIEGETVESFHQLQSIEDSSLAFTIVRPFSIVKDYDFVIPNSVKERLDIESREEVEVFIILTIPEDVQKTTLNLAAPLIVNFTNKLAKQVILSSNNYGTKHLLVEELEKSLGKGSSL